MEEFYRLLDQQRKDWYNQQIKDDLSKENESVSNNGDNSQNAKAEKKFEMFGDDSSEDEEGSMKLNQAAQL